MAWVKRILFLSLLLAPIQAPPLSAQHDPSQVQVFLDVTQNETSVNEGVPVSGLITLNVHVTGAQGMGVQVYANLVGYASVHHLTADHWTTQVTIDTSRYIDGEQLLNVHVHGHADRSQRIDTTQFVIGKRKIVTANNNPGPSTILLVLPTLPSVENAHIEAISGDPRSAGTTLSASRLLDGFYGNAVLVHANQSLLGRVTWSTEIPFNQFAIAPEEVTLNSALPFQGEMPTTFKAVFIVRDNVGRANVAERTITLPAADPGVMTAHPRPLPDARILNIGEFDEIVVPSEGEPFKVRVEVSNLSDGYDPKGLKLRLWVGNMILNIVPLEELIRKNAGRDRFVVEVPATNVEVALEGPERLLLSKAATATAVWVDFQTSGRELSSLHLSTSSHVHVNSFRTDKFNR